jgi:hypothetical protein
MQPMMLYFTCGAAPTKPIPTLLTSQEIVPTQSILPIAFWRILEFTVFPYKSWVVLNIVLSDNALARDLHYQLQNPDLEGTKKELKRSSGGASQTCVS